MSVENIQVSGDASVSRNVNAGGNARVQGNMHVWHNLRVDGAVEARNIKAANKGLFLDEAQLKARYPQPEEGWFAGVGETSPFTVYIANGGVWQRTTGTFSVDMDMDSYNQRIDELESQVESNNALIAELIEIIREGGGSTDLVMVTVENANPTWGSVSGGGLKRKGSVTLTATAESGYHFVEWQNEDGEQVSTEPTYTFDATESVTLKAVFAVSYYSVSATPNDSDLGEVTLVADNEETLDGYIHGTNITLTAAPKDNHNPTAYFVAWKENGVIVSRNAVYQFDLTKVVVLVAEFAEEVHISVVPSVEGRGSVEIAVKRNGQVVSADHIRIGDEVTLKATGTTNKPNGWTDESLAYTLSDDGTVMESTFTYDGSQSLNYTAKFDGDAIETRHTVSVAVTSGQSSYGSVHIEVGTDNVGTSASVIDGTNVKLHASANDGYTFVKWMDGSTDAGSDNPKTVTIDGADKAYKAVFEHAEEPDFYFGVFDTPQNNPVLDNINDDADLTKGWLTDNVKAQITLPTGKTFIVLWRSSVEPTACNITDDIGPGTLDLDSQQSFYATTKTLNNVAYTAREFYGGNTGSGNWSIEITFAANNSSQE